MTDQGGSDPVSACTPREDVPKTTCQSACAFSDSSGTSIQPQFWTWRMPGDSGPRQPPNPVTRTPFFMGDGEVLGAALFAMFDP
jgi:hypothetical protein